MEPVSTTARRRDAGGGIHGPARRETACSPSVIKCLLKTFQFRSVRFFKLVQNTLQLVLAVQFCSVIAGFDVAEGRYQSFMRRHLCCGFIIERLWIDVDSWVGGVACVARLTRVIASSFGQKCGLPVLMSLFPAFSCLFVQIHTNRIKAFAPFCFFLANLLPHQTSG